MKTLTEDFTEILLEVSKRRDNYEYVDFQEIVSKLISVIKPRISNAYYCLLPCQHCEKVDLMPLLLAHIIDGQSVEDGAPND